MGQNAAIAEQQKRRTMKHSVTWRIEKDLLENIKKAVEEQKPTYSSVTHAVEVALSEWLCKVSKKPLPN